MKTLNLLMAGVGLVALLFPAQAQPTTAPTTAPTAEAVPAKVLTQSELEKQFAERLTGAVLVGRFDDDANPDRAPREERYTLQKVSKIPLTERWLFAARIQFGGKDVLIPLTIPVKWAGDTPVISVTDMTIPKLGTYTARVMVYGDQYAGTWRGAKHGGHMWGHIERVGEGEKPETAASPATKPAP